MSYCIIMSAFSSEIEARDTAEHLVGRNLAACVQISRVNSVYKWQGELKNTPEYLLMIKTETDMYERIEREIKELHSYKVPEITMLPMTNGLTEYFEWISTALHGPLNEE